MTNQVGVSSYVVRRKRCGVRCAAWLFFGCTTAVGAQITPYVGVIGGVATISADGGARSTGSGLSLSSYAPSNGGALNVFAGLPIHNYVSLQLDYIWNQNRLQLNSATSDSNAFYQEDRSSTQQAVIFDGLLYFRNRRSRIRPYLGTGVGAVHLSSTETRLVSAGGNPSLPPSQLTSTGPALRSHVGIDFRLASRLDFRYSFSDTIGRNPISKYLSPPGPRILENFQNLFGFVVRF
jgi:outer membrane protein W